MSNFRCEFLTGSAGTGKTTTLKNRIKELSVHRNYATLCATTGIAAVNLGDSWSNVCTLNSELKYFDTNSLQENYAAGKLQKALLRVVSKGLNLAIDEISMMEARALDILFMAMTEVNRLVEVEKRGGLGLILTGDFCQLMPIQGEYAFKAECWKEFSNGNITRLEKVWRQDNLEFLEALNAARRGDGDKTAEILCDIENSQSFNDGEREGEERKIFYENIDVDFDGTTICALNRDVDRINNVRLIQLYGMEKDKITFESYRWGKQRGEWKLIPDKLELAEDAYVMILSNNPPGFDYANGDCGYLRSASVDTGVGYVELKRNGNGVSVRMVTRRVMEKEEPFGFRVVVKDFKNKSLYKEWLENSDPLITGKEVDLQYKRYLSNLTNENRVAGQPYYDYEEGKYVVGEISYMPLRLAYASTCHKVQGLTLDSVQLDIYNKFFGSPSMAYVALSRVRDPKGLRVVGRPKLLADRTNVLEDILPWI